MGSVAYLWGRVEDLEELRKEVYLFLAGERRKHSDGKKNGFPAQIQSFYQSYPISLVTFTFFLWKRTLL